MLSRLRSLGQRRMFRAVAVVVGGTAGAQLITVLASPLLSRLFTPSEFGAFSAFSAVAAILAGLGAMRLESAIPLAVGEDKARHVARLGLLAAMSIALVVLVLCLALPGAVHRVAGVPPHLQLLLPVYVIGFGGSAVLGQVAIRRRQYRLFAQRKIVHSGSTVTVQLLAGLGQLGSFGLALGYAVGQVVAFLSLVRVSGISRGKSSASDLRSAARDNRRFPLLLMPSGLLNSLGTHVPTLLIIGVFGVTVGGWYGLTQRILAAPVALVGASLSQVYIGELANLHRTGASSAATLFRRTSRVLLGASLALALAVAVLAVPLFPVVFGDQWRESGYYAQALSIGIAGQLAAAPLAQTLIVADRLGWKVVWDSTRLGAMSAAVVIPGMLGASALVAVWTLGAVQVVVYAFLWFLCRSAISHFGERQSSDLTAAASPDHVGSEVVHDDEGSPGR